MFFLLLLQAMRADQSTDNSHPHSGRRLKFIFRLFEKSERIRISVMTLLMSLLAVFDFVAVFFIGLTTIMALGNLESSRLPQPVIRVIDEGFGFSLNPYNATIKVAVIATLLLIVRTMFSVYFTRKLFVTLSLYGARLSVSLFSKLMKAPPNILLNLNSQEVTHTLTYGVRSALMDVMAPTMIVFSDLLLLVILFFGLMYIDFWLAICTILFFGSIGGFLFYLLHIKAGALGKQNAELEIASNKKLVEVFKTYKQIYVSNQENFHLSKFRDLRTKFASIDSYRSFLPYIGKYIIESSVVLGVLFITGTQLVINPSDVAISNVAIFIAASTRVAPAILRVQQASVQIMGGIGISHRLLHLSSSLEAFKPSVPFSGKADMARTDFKPKVSIKDMSFRYANSTNFTLTDINCEIEDGEFILVAGPSGSGKSTLVDLVLGILEPRNGEITISGLPPKVALKKWAGRTAYVPQDVFITDGTIFENITLGHSVNSKTDLNEIFEFASLTEFVENLPETFSYKVGENGLGLSGGQKQRPALARAYFFKPQLLVLDEPTSSLDVLSEEKIIRSLNNSRGKFTTIMISHKVSKLARPDKVVVLNHGKIEFMGSLEQCMKDLPNIFIDFSK
jgi:ATP-binding cassette, subfamily B, bacterial PglK